MRYAGLQPPQESISWQSQMLQVGTDPTAYRELISKQCCDLITWGRGRRAVDLYSSLTLAYNRSSGSFSQFGHFTNWWKVGKVEARDTWLKSPDMLMRAFGFVFAVLGYLCVWCHICLTLQWCGVRTVHLPGFSTLFSMVVTLLNSLGPNWIVSVKSYL